MQVNYAHWAAVECCTYLKCRAAPPEVWPPHIQSLELDWWSSHHFTKRVPFRGVISSQSPSLPDAWNARSFWMMLCVAVMNCIRTGWREWNFVHFATQMYMHEIKMRCVVCIFIFCLAEYNLWPCIWMCCISINDDRCCVLFIHSRFLGGFQVFLFYFSSSNACNWSRTWSEE